VLVQHVNHSIAQSRQAKQATDENKRNHTTLAVRGYEHASPSERWRLNLLIKIAFQRGGNAGGFYQRAGPVLQLESKPIHFLNGLQFLTC
jgi:hypothetical protein